MSQQRAKDAKRLQVGTLRVGEGDPLLDKFLLLLGQQAGPRRQREFHRRILAIGMVHYLKAIGDEQPAPAMEEPPAAAPPAAGRAPRATSPRRARPPVAPGASAKAPKPATTTPPPPPPAAAAGGLSRGAQAIRSFFPEE